MKTLTRALSAALLLAASSLSMAAEPTTWEKIKSYAHESKKEAVAEGKKAIAAKSPATPKPPKKLVPRTAPKAEVQPAAETAPVPEAPLAAPVATAAAAVKAKPFRKPKARVVGTYRLLRQDVALANGGFYSAGEFDLAPLIAQSGPGRHREDARPATGPLTR